MTIAAAVALNRSLTFIEHCLAFVLLQHQENPPLLTI